MPTNGLSLVGFMNQAEALNFLKNGCIPGAKTDPQLVADWQAAQAKLGGPTSNPGHPNIQPIPPSHQQYLQQAPLVQALAAAPNAAFQWVEIDPLLAFQFIVDTDRSAHHCSNVSQPPTLDELLVLCVPTSIPPEPLAANQQGQSLLIESRSLNVRLLQQGMLYPMNGIAGVQFGMASPIVRVGRYNGRCYLSNGFHRAYGARLAGATHVPCIFADMPDSQSVGIRDDGSTFKLQLLESANPPTVGHFTQGKAQSVLLRAASRIIHVSWSDYVVFDE